MDNNKHDENDSDSVDSILGLGGLDFAGVDFDAPVNPIDNDLTPNEKTALELERKAAFGDFEDEKCNIKRDDNKDLSRVLELGHYLASGNYIDALKGESAQKYFGQPIVNGNGNGDPTATAATVPSNVRQILLEKVHNVVDCVEVEFLGIAALNLFLQLNYTGPSLDKAIQMPSVTNSTEAEKDPLAGINPHSCFAAQLSSIMDENGYITSIALANTKEETKTADQGNGITTSSFTNTKFHNAVLSELSVDGEWPCQVCEVPYLLLLARSILLPLSNADHPGWLTASSLTEMVSTGSAATAAANEATPATPKSFTDISSKLAGVHLWSARAAVAHGRLLQTREPPKTLWEEVEPTFQACLAEFCQDNATNDEKENGTQKQRKTAATVLLEYGLAQHHFEQPGMGKASFLKAKEQSGLTVSVTGASGKRTKFQTKNTAQYLVEASSASTATATNKNNAADDDDNTGSSLIREQKVEHGEDEILLERIKFEDESKNEIKDLSILDQAILLSLCLDVKNSNPSGDDLTAEEMGAYLARVLDHHDDWMLYSTALLERAWLEFERTHGRERAILQIQALADQHTNRLTLTQSTKKSIEESAPAQDRLRNLHTIVYPPRWGMFQDLADRYANLGICMSAAELYTQIELWDEVVECYRRSGRAEKAEEIVRERLAIQETPRMWAALGDLTQDPQYWEKSVELSRGRFSTAYIALGAYYFDKRDLVKSAEYYNKALEIRPVAPAVWFRLGTISMQTAKWDDALRAFSRVAQLEPEEHEAWANVAAVHIRNKNPTEAYPALQESLKYNRNSWRVWTSKLYVCLDLKKYDEAVQACNSILDLKSKKQAADGIPPLEEKCVRALVGGSLRNYETARQEQNVTGIDVAKRGLTRVHALLERLQATSNPEPWLYETVAFFHEAIGGADGSTSREVVDNLMKEYRALQTVPSWEKDDHQVKKVCQVAGQICEIQRRQGNKEGLTKGKFLVRGVIQKVRKSRMDATKVPADIDRMEKLLADLEIDIQNLKS